MPPLPPLNLTAAQGSAYECIKLMQEAHKLRPALKKVMQRTIAVYGEPGAISEQADGDALKEIVNMLFQDPDVDLRPLVLRALVYCSELEHSFKETRNE